MERFYGVEEARGHLGRLVEEVAASGQHVALTKRVKALAVIVSRDEYFQLRQLMTERARSELATRLAPVRQQVEELRLNAEVIDQAIDAARRAD